MNSDLAPDDPTILYNDSDYPSKDHGPFPENFDAVTERQGIAHDVDRYLDIARACGGPMLEIGCGSGRIGIALARAGIEICGVDVSTGMLEYYRQKLETEPRALANRITLIHADASTLELDQREFALAIIPFNTLLCIHDFEQQQAVFKRVSTHLRPAGRLIIDVINPYKINAFGDPTPKPFFTRRNVWTGRQYTRFAAAGPLDAAQRQNLFGWYDELREDGAVLRKPYSFFLRPVFRYELTLMLENAGFEIEKIEGGHQGEPFTEDSPKMFVWARKVSAPSAHSS